MIESSTPIPAASWLLPLSAPYRWFDAARKLLKSVLHS